VVHYFSEEELHQQDILPLVRHTPSDVGIEIVEYGILESHDSTHLNQRVWTILYA
jgi:hypothetical protein